MGVDGDVAIDAEFGTSHEITFGGADVEKLTKTKDAEGFGVDTTAATLEGVGDNITVFTKDTEDEAGGFEGNITAVTRTVGGCSNFAVIAEDNRTLISFEKNVTPFSGCGAGVDATLVTEEDFAGLGLEVAGVTCSGIADGSLGVVLNVNGSGGGKGGVTGCAGTRG